MSSTNGSGPVEPKAPRKRAPKAPTSKDPEVLAAEIEKTREDLAETLDAIAEKVSPKRVTARTRKKVADKVSDVTEQVREAAAGAKDRAVEQAGHAKEAATPDRATTAPTGVEPLPPVTAVQADGLDLTTAPVVTPTTTPTVDATSTAPVFPAPPPSAAGTGLPREALAGGALGLVVLLLLRRRRAKRRAVRTGAAAALVGVASDLRGDFEKGRKKARRRKR